MAGIACHYRPKNSIIVKSYQKELWLAGQLGRNRDLRYVPGPIIGKGFDPQRLDAAKVLRLIGRDCDHLRKGRARRITLESTGLPRQATLAAWRNVNHDASRPGLTAAASPVE
jgi:hypothetical protein